MEEPTRFDLNAAIRQWRGNLESSPAVHGDDLTELETHLHDSVAVLQARGLSDREAFWVASGRLGPTAALDAEFQKARPERVWLSRCLWMLTGWLLIGLLSSLASAGANLVAAAAFALNWAYDGLWSPQAIGLISLVFHLLFLAGLVNVIWRSGKRSEGWVWRVASWMSRRPLFASLGVFGLLLLQSVSSLAATFISVRSLSLPVFGAIVMWHSWVNVACLLFCPLALGWLLARRDRAQSA